MRHLPVRRLAGIASMLWLPILHAQAFSDPSPHRVGSVRHGGARLHYLEWGAKGPMVVLLPGYSLTAHVFDEIGPALAGSYHVIALTPRGFGESDAPDSSAYTVSTLVEDLHALFDSLRIERAALVGHSLAGTVAVDFALRYPARVTRLALLDAFPFIAPAVWDSITSLDPVAVPPFLGDTTYAAAAIYLARHRYSPWRPSFDADLRAKPLGAEGARRRALTAGYIADQSRGWPDLRRLTIRTLELCAIPTVASEYPWLTRTDPAHRAAQHYVTAYLRPFQRRMCAHFESIVPGGRSEELSGSHYLFFTDPMVTVRALRRFLR